MPGSCGFLADYCGLLRETANQPTEGNALLFQPHLFANPIINEIVEEQLLIGIEAGKRGPAWRFLAPPQQTMRHQRLAIHQQGAHVGKHASQTVEHGKTVGVDIAPV
jgi:hypothetical protein